MMKKNIVIVLIVLPLLGVIWYGVKHPGLSPEQKLENAKQALLTDSPTIRSLYTNINTNYSIQIKLGSLQGNALGQTLVLTDRAIITIDVEKVIRKRDRLEPVLAHELIHVNDARFVIGFEKFFQYVEEDKELAWENRRVEISAYTQEDKVRQELLSTGKYNGMAPTRRMQNVKN